MTAAHRCDLGPLEVFFSRSSTFAHAQVHQLLEPVDRPTAESGMPGCFTALLRTLAIALLSSTALGTQNHPVLSHVCDATGLDQSPRHCSQGDRFLPSTFGGPSTLNQCIFGDPQPAGGIFGGGQSCWTGSLFGFSGRCRSLYLPYRSLSLSVFVR
jgi:hypothetical protein